MGRSAAAEGQQRVASRILRFLDDVDAGRGGHVLVDQLMDTPCCLDYRLSEPPTKSTDGRFRGFAIERHRPAQEIVRIQVPEQQVSIRDGWLRSPAAVAGRSRVSA